MELNGIVNMELIVSMAKKDGKIDESVANNLNEQIQVMYAYMNEVFKVAQINSAKVRGCGLKPELVRPWHEIRIETINK